MIQKKDVYQLKILCFIFTRCGAIWVFSVFDRDVLHGIDGSGFSFGGFKQ